MPHKYWLFDPNGSIFQEALFRLRTSKGRRVNSDADEFFTREVREALNMSGYWPAAEKLASLTEEQWVLAARAALLFILDKHVFGEQLSQASELVERKMTQIAKEAESPRASAARVRRNESEAK